MKFPLRITKQAKCPICKKPGAGKKSPSAPRPEVASLTFTVMSFVHGKSYPVFLGSHFMLGWDSGESKHPDSRSSLGAAFFVAAKNGRKSDVGQMEICFCSVRCLRKFFKAACDELDRRIAEVKPEVQKAKRLRQAR